MGVIIGLLTDLQSYSTMSIKNNYRNLFTSATLENIHRKPEISENAAAASLIAVICRSMPDSAEAYARVSRETRLLPRSMIQSGTIHRARGQREMYCANERGRHS